MTFESFKSLFEHGRQIRLIEDEFEKSIENIPLFSNFGEVSISSFSEEYNKMIEEILTDNFPLTEIEISHFVYDLCYLSGENWNDEIISDDKFYVINNITDAYNYCVELRDNCDVDMKR